MQLENNSGSLLRIWLKRFRRGPMDEVSSARLLRNRGLEGNTDQGGKRQVTLLCAESWKETGEELGVSLDPSLRRANLLVSGLSLRGCRGRRLQIGPALLLLNGETRPCERMDEAHPGLRLALQSNWRGGAYAEVVESGEIRVGDPVLIR